MMHEYRIDPVKNGMTGEIEVPGDKSISHRAVMLGALAEGQTKVSHFLNSEDCLRTVKAFRAMGVDIKEDGDTLTIKSNGRKELKEPLEPLYFGNSGTTARLMLGLLSGLPFFSTVYGDESLTHRPMDRVINPLREMNADIIGRDNSKFLPLALNGKKLQGIDYTMQVKSAQVKSAILLAGLFAEGETRVTEITQTRNHTETMLEAFGANLRTDGNTVIISGDKELKATDVYVPGDISSAAFFLGGAAAKPNSNLTLKNVGLNETRTGILDVLSQMGAQIEISNEQKTGGEKFGDIHIAGSDLKGIEISGEIIPRLIDEIPIIALAATQAEGKTIIRDAEELRVKETDRIQAVVDVLSKLGAKITGTPDGMIIEGKTELTGGRIPSYGDHRIAMMGAIAALFTQSEVCIDDISSVDISYPGFFDDFNRVING